MRTFLLLFFCCILIVTSLSSNTLRVPQNYATIQAAINAAHTSDTILVAEGTYYENIRYHGKGIVVASNYMFTKNWQIVQNTIINGSTCVNKDTASTVQFLDREDSTAILDGFTITGGTGTRYLFPNGTGTNRMQEGAGIVLHYSSATIRNNIITNNDVQPQSGVSRGGGGGIASMYGNPTIIDNIIMGNSAAYAGGVVLNWSDGKIFNNIFYHNVGGNTDGTGWGSGAVMIQEPTPTNSAFAKNNTVIGNISLTPGFPGGIDINGTVNGSPSAPFVCNNLVWANRQLLGSQINQTQYCSYNDVEDYSNGTNISTFPQLQANTFLLSSTSPCIDAGDAAISYNDIENSSHPGFALSPSQGTIRNDIGAFGGFFAKALPSIDTSDFRLSGNSISLQCSTNCKKTTGIELLNLSSKILTIDSVTVSDTATFSLNKNFTRQTVNFLTYDSIKITFRPSTRSNFNDTIRVYHHIAGKTNPLKIPISATSNYIPFLNKSIPAQTAYVDQLFTFQIPDSTFLDPDIGDTLLYQASGLPSWLSFNAQTHTFQGTPTQTARLITIGITVNDLLLTSASTTLRMAVVTPTTDVDNSPTSPSKYELRQNYPNPFNPVTMISYQVPISNHVILKVFDVLGKEVATLVNEVKNVGRYSVEWNASGLPSGVYFCSITSNNLTQIRKMVLLK